MRVLVLHAHPDPESFSAELYRDAVSVLTLAGHDVAALDLYARGFDPVLSREEWRRYTVVADNRRAVETEVAELLSADALVFVAPVWNFGPPAILKGFLDRVFLPGVAFDLTSGRVSPGLRQVRRIVVVTTYGSTRLWAMLVGDPPRKLYGRMLRALISPGGRCTYLAHYGIARSTDASRAAFAARMRTELGRLGR